MNMHIVRSALALAVMAAVVGCRNNETAKGDANDAKGHVEQAVGDVVGSDSMQNAGKVDETKGKVQKAVGSVEPASKP
jgi:uncharacterized protein YjbJ (UPF0337 family)